MSNDMTAEEFEELRCGESIGAKEFLIARSKETIDIPLTSQACTKNIEIRTRLSKSELQANSIFLSTFKEAGKLNPSAIELLDSKYGDKITAEFMAMITVDPELDATFWMLDNTDPGTIQEVLIGYFSKQMRI